MPGIVRYSNLADALRDGFRVHDRTSDGYIILRNRPDGLVEKALVQYADLAVPDDQC